MPGFTTYMDQGGLNGRLEKAFSAAEGKAIGLIRRILQSQGPDTKRAVADFFAIHMVRNPSFKAMHKRITDNYRETVVEKFTTSDELRVRFVLQYGRIAGEDEIHQLVRRTYDDYVGQQETTVDSTFRHWKNISAKLDEFHMQVIQIGEDLPGFAFGDVPFVHASTKLRKYGFRDHLAIGDANLIVGPLSKDVAVCFTAHEYPPTSIGSIVDLDTLNAIFIRAANKEVACNPSHIDYLQEVASRLDALPPEAMLAPSPQGTSPRSPRVD
jgi:hypothetical protein